MPTPFYDTKNTRLPIMVRLLVSFLVCLTCLLIYCVIQQITCDIAEKNYIDDYANYVVPAYYAKHHVWPMSSKEVEAEFEDGSLNSWPKPPSQSEQLYKDDLHSFQVFFDQYHKAVARRYRIYGPVINLVQSADCIALYEIRFSMNKRGRDTFYARAFFCKDEQQ